MNKREVIVELAAEGGSFVLYGVRTGRRWLYSRSVIDWTPELIDEAHIRQKSDVVTSWKAVLRLLDQYPWHRLSPLIVHPAFRQKIWAAVQKRVDGDEHLTRRLERWREICGQPAQQG